MKKSVLRGYTTEVWATAAARAATVSLLKQEKVEKNFNPLTSEH